MAKIYEITFCVATDKKAFSTNHLKAELTKLLSLGKAGKVVNSVLTPVKGKTQIESYLMQKTDCRFFRGEMIVLLTKEKLADDTVITSTVLMNKLTDVIPCLADKASGLPLGLEVLSIKCKKL